MPRRPTSRARPTSHRAIGLVARVPDDRRRLRAPAARAEPVAPRSELGHAANYLYMLNGDAPADAVVRALETYLNTVVDHGMNASTFTARVIASTRSDMVSALVGAVGALKGPLHGGAPGPALDMVFEIRARAAASGRASADEAASQRVREIDRRRRAHHGLRPSRLQGARSARRGARRRGRAPVRAAAAIAVSTTMRARSRTSSCASSHELKPGRRLETNVEFYTALLLHGIGLETELFTPTFAVARAGGWTAHVLEQNDEDRLIRPAAVYVGPQHPHWGAPGPGERMCA